MTIWICHLGSVEATDIDGNVATANTPKNGEIGAQLLWTHPKVARLHTHQKVLICGSLLKLRTQIAILPVMGKQ